MLLNELRKLKKNQTFLSVERDCGEDELTGYVLVVNKQFVVMSLYDSTGGFDGFTMFETDQIDEVYWGNREHKAIELLVNSSSSKPLPKFEASKFVDAMSEVNSAFSSLCLYSHHSENHFDIAHITAADTKWLKLHTFGKKGNLSRLTKMIRVDAISRVDFDSPYQNGIVHLHESGI